MIALHTSSHLLLRENEFPFKKCAAREECSKLCIHSVLLQECNPPKHATLCHSSANLPSLVVSIQHCGRWDGGRAIWRCIPMADHSKTLASAWTHALRQYTSDQRPPGGAGKKEMRDREATPSISLKKSHFRHSGHHDQIAPVWRMLIKSLRWHTVGKMPQCQCQHTLTQSTGEHHTHLCCHATHWWLTMLTLNNPTILIKHIRWSLDALILTHLFLKKQFT